MHLKKEETFESRYENPIDLPGRWYLQVIQQLFQENRLANGQFVGLGRRLNLHDITCPAYLLAGADDDITTPEQGLDAAKYLGTPKDRIIQKTAPGAHIGLFMGARIFEGALAGDCPVDHRPKDLAPDQKVSRWGRLN